MPYTPGPKELQQRALRERKQATSKRPTVAELRKVVASAAKRAKAKKPKKGARR